VRQLFRVGQEGSLFRDRGGSLVKFGGLYSSDDMWSEIWREQNVRRLQF